MKKFIIVFAMIITAYMASAQRARLNAYGSYVFDDGFDMYTNVDTYFRGKIKGGFQWGASIEYLPAPHYAVELSYINQATTAPTTFKGGLTSPERNENLDVTLHYILLGGNRLQSAGNGKVEAYGGLMGGVLITDVKVPSNGASGSNTTFAWGGKIGANIWATEKFGVKLQAQLLSSIRAAGGDVYYGYWGPVVLESYAAIWQFSLGGGLTFKLGK